MQGDYYQLDSAKQFLQHNMEELNSKTLGTRNAKGLSNNLQTEALIWPHPKTVPLVFILLLLTDSPKHLHSPILIFNFLISVEWTIYQIWWWSWSPRCELISTIIRPDCVLAKLPQENVSINIIFHGCHPRFNSKVNMNILVLHLVCVYIQHLCNSDLFVKNNIQRKLVNSAKDASDYRSLKGKKMLKPLE